MELQKVLTDHDLALFISICKKYREYNREYNYKPIPPAFRDGLTDLFEIIEIQISKKNNIKSVTDILTDDFMSSYAIYCCENSTILKNAIGENSTILKNAPLNKKQSQFFEKLRKTEHCFLSDEILTELFLKENDEHTKEFREVKALLNITSAHGFINSLLTERTAQSKRILALELDSLSLIRFMQNINSDFLPDLQPTLYEQHLIELMQNYSVIREYTHILNKKFRDPSTLNSYLAYPTDKLEKTNRVNALQCFYKGYEPDTNDLEYWIANREVLKHLFVSYRHFTGMREQLFFIIDEGLKSKEFKHIHKTFK